MNKNLLRDLFILLIMIFCISIFAFAKSKNIGGVINSSNIKESNFSDNRNWELNSLYKSDEEWKSELKKFDRDKDELKNYLGKIKSKNKIAFALDVKEKLDEKFDRLSAYPKLKQDLDKKNLKYVNMNDDLDKVSRGYSDICSKFEVEISKVPNKEFNKLLNDKKINKRFGLYLGEIKKDRSHYLSESSESVLNNASQLGNMPSILYEIFDNMDRKNEISPAEYYANMESNDRNIREKTYNGELSSYNENINLLSEILKGQVKKNVFYSKSRGYKSSLDMYLDSDGINKKEYNNLIEVVNKHIGGLNKYIALRKKILHLDKVHSYDMSAPLIKSFEGNCNYDKAQDVVYSSLKPLGKEYSDVLYKAFNENWIDVYSDKNKVGGGYCLSIYNNHPYILLNYNNKFDSVSTLIHELGHAVYSYIASKNQTYYNANPPILTQEIASTTNEVLLYENFIKNAKDKEEKAYYVSRYLDLIKNTIFVQTMYSEFERSIHYKIENGENVNTNVLNNLWGKLLEKYYGKDYKLDSLSKISWARIPHFYNSFYVYKYATGCSAGISFAQDIQKNGPDNYIDFLKKGNSDNSKELLKTHKINIGNKKYIENAIKKFDDLVVELQKIKDDK